MSAFDERRDQDVQKLRDLQKQSLDRIRVTHVSGRPANEIEVELHVRTAPSAQYPRATQDLTRLLISLPGRYPFVAPTVTVTTPILHPNIYTSGRVCLGMQWLPSFGLDLLVRRILQIVTFDPSLLNEKSPANCDALSWYRRARHAHADAFPTDILTLFGGEQPKSIKWDNVAPEPTKIILSCPNCPQRLSVPTGRAGRIKCPSCGNFFRADT